MKQAVGFREVRCFGMNAFAKSPLHSMASLGSALAFQPVPIPYLIVALLLVKSKPATVPIKGWLASKSLRNGLTTNHNV